VAILLVAIGLVVMLVILLMAIGAYSIDDY
jgi:hypothetical protein